MIPFLIGLGIGVIVTAIVDWLFSAWTIHMDQVHAEPSILSAEQHQRLKEMAEEKNMSIGRFENTLVLERMAELEEKQDEKNG